MTFDKKETKAKTAKVSAMKQIKEVFKKSKMNGEVVSYLVKKI